MMNRPATAEAAQSFLHAYQDTEIDKRLFFDVWADRAGYAPEDQTRVWREVVRMTYRLAARKRNQTRGQRMARGGFPRGAAQPYNAGLAAVE